MALPRSPVHLLQKLLLICLPVSTFAGSYLDSTELEARVRDLNREFQSVVGIRQLAMTPRSNSVWLVELSALPKEKRGMAPAMLAVAGVEGNDLAGSAVLMGWLETLASGFTTNDNIKAILESSTIYVIPRLNPEGATRYFRKPRIEADNDAEPTDEDHDGKVDEDSPQDLNGDGLVTTMRVADPAGEYMQDPQEPRLLMRVDRTKGESGSWKVYPESLDVDGDEQWGEDGEGGVNYNRNFPFGYKYFSRGAGADPVSTPVTRALADFVVAHPHIGICFTFGAADNLVQTPKSEPPKRPPSALNEADLSWYREMGKEWRKAVGLSKELTGASEPGSFSDWFYFDRGRLSLAARVWTPAIQIELAKDKSGGDSRSTDKPKSEQEKSPENKDAKPAAKEQKEDKRNEEERSFLKWLDEHSPEGFVPWVSYKHPDFKDKVVEIGGFAPFALSNPPQQFMAEFVNKETTFLTLLAGKLPRISLRKIEVEGSGKDVFTVTIQVENKGYLPTSLAQGALTREVLQTRVELELEANQVLTGAKRIMLGPIEGSGGMKEARFVLHTSRKEVKLRVVSALGGTIESTVNLREAK